MLEATSVLRLSFSRASGRRKDRAERRMPAQLHLLCGAAHPLSRTEIRGLMFQQLEQTGQTAWGSRLESKSCVSSTVWERTPELCAVQGSNSLCSYKGKKQMLAGMQSHACSFLNSCIDEMKGAAPQRQLLYCIFLTPSQVGEEAGNGLVPQGNHIPCSLHPPVPKPACLLCHAQIFVLMKLFPFRACFPYLGFIRAAMLE